MITAWGYTNPPIGALVTKMGPLPINFDITWGIFMTVFGVAMFSLAKLDEALGMERALAEEKAKAAALELGAAIAAAPESLLSVATNPVEPVTESVVANPVEPVTESVVANPVETAAEIVATDPVETSAGNSVESAVSSADENSASTSADTAAESDAQTSTDKA
jgi:hypothetical protein